MSNEQITNNRYQVTKEDCCILTLLVNLALRVVSNIKDKASCLNFVTCYLLPVICFILLFSCNSPSRDSSRPPSPTVEVGQSDKEIEKIADNARRSLPIFFRNLNRLEKGANNFYVKYSLISDDGSVEPKVREQVWLGSIRFKNDAYYGTPANTPISHGRKMKRVNIDTDKITDWMYIQDGKIIGGRSIKYLLEKIPEDQRGGEQRRILRMFE